MGKILQKFTFKFFSAEVHCLSKVKLLVYWDQATNFSYYLRHDIYLRYDVIEGIA